MSSERIAADEEPLYPASQRQRLMRAAGLDQDLSGSRSCNPYFLTDVDVDGLVGVLEQAKVRLAEDRVMHACAAEETLGESQVVWEGEDETGRWRTNRKPDGGFDVERLRDDQRWETWGSWRSSSFWTKTIEGLLRARDVRLNLPSTYPREIWVGTLPGCNARSRLTEVTRGEFVREFEAILQVDAMGKARSNWSRSATVDAFETAVLTHLLYGDNNEDA